VDAPQHARLSDGVDAAMIEVLVATESDVHDVISLESRLFAEDSGVHEPYADVEWPAREGAGDFADLLENPDAIVFLALAGAEAVGLLMADAAASGPTRQPIRYAVLRSMYVSHGHRRAGVASALIDEFLAWARRQGCAEVQVNHYVANEPAGELYERFGFEPHSLNRVLRL